MGWLMVLAVIAALSVLPLGISAKYDSAGAGLWLIAGPVRVKLYPRPSRETRKKKPKKEKSKQEKPAQASSKKKENGGSAADFFPLVRIVFDFLADFHRKLRVNVLELKVLLAGDDPCDLAVNYGRACAAIGNLEPHLERLFIIKKKSLLVEPDFTADKTRIWARLDLTVTLGRLLSLLARHGSRTLREILKIMKLRKGGAIQ